jgi:hypothetical protein
MVLRAGNTVQPFLIVRPCDFNVRRLRTCRPLDSFGSCDRQEGETETSWNEVFDVCSARNVPTTFGLPSPCLPWIWGSNIASHQADCI